MALLKVIIIFIGFLVFTGWLRYRAIQDTKNGL
jgi:hypothetical protein